MTRSITIISLNSSARNHTQFPIEDDVISLADLELNLSEAAFSLDCRRRMQSGFIDRERIIRSADFGMELPTSSQRHRSSGTNGRLYQSRHHDRDRGSVSSRKPSPFIVVH